MKTAWVFPGQGSQVLNMGVDLQDISTAQAKFKQAEELLGWSVLEISQGDEEKLSRTLYTQPSLFVIEAILADLLLENGHYPDLVTGHSLGEYSALYTTRVFDFPTGLKLVKVRAELMDTVQGGKMVALMKFDRRVLEQTLARFPDLVLANDNSEQQVVISGTPEIVDQALTEIQAKRAIPLKVSGAFHSPLMAGVSQRFQTVLETVTFENPKVPVLSNIDPSPCTDGNQLRERLSQQMTGSVRWREIMLSFPQEQVDLAIEVGPGNVLTGLIKRTCPNIALKNVQTFADIY
jgi:[acyl-carrier-protein] S-malonyltransferase